MSGLDASPGGSRPLIIVAEDNLFLRPRIESSLGAAALEPCFVLGREALESALERGPAGMLVNLASPRLDWRALVSDARRVAGAGLPIVGYGPHVDPDLLRSARAAGCTETVPNGLVGKNAAGVIGVHLAAND